MVSLSKEEFDKMEKLQKDITNEIATEDFVSLDEKIKIANSNE